MNITTAEGKIAADLLAHLRTALGDNDIQYAKPPVRITGGFDTEIYAFRVHGAGEEWSGPLILRFFRSDNSMVTLSGPERARFETAVQNAIHSMGYPAPRVLYTCADSESLGAAFLVMERMPGRVMLELLFRPSRFWFRLPDILAEAQARLHGLQPQVLRQAVEAADVPGRVLTVGDWLEQIASLIGEAQLEGLKPGLAWLLDNEPNNSQSTVICHGDFHPLNILMGKSRVTGVIDWPWVKVAPPEYDVGATIAIFGQGPLDLPAFLSGAFNVFRRQAIARYLRAYQRLRPLDARAIRYYEAVRLIGFLFEAGEQRQADLGIMTGPVKPTAFGAQLGVKRIILRFREITGIALRLPPRTSRIS